MPRLSLSSAERHTRRNLLLDAAEDLLVNGGGLQARVEDIARRAGVAKGSVYLVFPSKEELWLALHERHVDVFFNALHTRTDSDARMQTNDIMRLVREHIITPPQVLPLASHCLGLLEYSTSLAAAIAFKKSIARRLHHAGEGLHRHFPMLSPGEAAGLLIHSHALTVGLWQLLHPTRLTEHIRRDPALSLLNRSYPDELEQALDALWRGRTGEPTPTVPQR